MAGNDHRFGFIAKQHRDGGCEPSLGKWPSGRDRRHGFLIAKTKVPRWACGSAMCSVPEGKTGRDDVAIVASGVAPAHHQASWSSNIRTLLFSTEPTTSRDDWIFASFHRMAEGDDSDQCMSELLLLELWIPGAMMVGLPLASPLRDRKRLGQVGPATEPVEDPGCWTVHTRGEDTRALVSEFGSRHLGKGWPYIEQCLQGC